MARHTKKNAGINLRKFNYQLTDWYNDWMELFDPIQQLRDDGAVYGERYVIKQDSAKRNKSWAVFTDGRYFKRHKKNKHNIHQDIPMEFFDEEKELEKLKKALRTKWSIPEVVDKA